MLTSLPLESLEQMMCFLAMRWLIGWGLKEMKQIIGG
jgi:hypothetical protein